MDMNAARIWVLLGRLPLRVVHQIRWSGSKLITRADLCGRLVSRTYAGGLCAEPTRAARRRAAAPRRRQACALARRSGARSPGRPARLGTCPGICDGLSRPTAVLTARDQAGTSCSPVSVPQLGSRGHPAERAGDQLAHDPVARRVDPDHRVGAAPDNVADLGVVAIDDPGRACCEVRNNPPELAGRQRLPVRLMKYGVELEVRGAQTCRKTPGNGGLPRAAVADHGDPLHEPSIGDDNPLRRPHSPPWRHLYT